MDARPVSGTTLRRRLFGWLSILVLTKLHEHSGERLSRDDKALIESILRTERSKRGYSVDDSRDYIDADGDGALPAWLDDDQLKTARDALITSARDRMDTRAALMLANNVAQGKIADVQAALAHVKIDHGSNNPRNKSVLRKRFGELLMKHGIDVRRAIG